MPHVQQPIRIHGKNIITNGSKINKATAKIGVTMNPKGPRHKQNGLRTIRPAITRVIKKKM